MRIILEQILIGCGIIGLIPMLCIHFYPSVPAGFIEFFRGGNMGGIITAILICLSIFGSLFFFVNLFSGVSAFWALRLGSILVFSIGLITISSRM